MKRIMLVIALAVITANALAVEPPKFKLMDAKKYVVNFPIDGSVSVAELFAKYGPPQQQMKDLPGGITAWFYTPWGGDQGCETYQGMKICGSKVYTFYLKDDVVVDVIISWPGGTFNPKPKQASKLQKRKK